MIFPMAIRRFAPAQVFAMLAPAFAARAQVSWQAVSPATRVSRIAVAPNGQLFAACPLIGIYRSTDASGTAWQLFTAGIGNLDLTAIAVHPAVANLVLAGSEDLTTHNSQLYRSTDGGQNWQATFTAAGTIQGFNGIAISPLTGTALAGAGYGRAIYRSTDLGLNWLPSDSGFPTSPVTVTIGLIVTRDGIFYAGTENYGVYQSLDDGVSWSQKSIGLPTGTGSPNDVWDIAANYSGLGTPYDLFAARTASTVGLSRSTDQAQSWSMVAAASFSSLPLYAAAADGCGDVYAGGNASGNPANGAYQSTDRGTSYTAVNGGLTNLRVKALAYNPVSGYLFAGTTLSSGIGGVYRTLQPLHPGDFDCDGSAHGVDCDDNDPALWAIPGEAQLLTVLKNGAALQISWSVPASFGGTQAPLYDLLRSNAPNDFTAAATCAASGITATSGADAPAGSAFYLARARNRCGGNLGADSGGTPINGRSCP